MLFFVRSNVGLGGNAIYARLKNFSGEYWDFSNLAWTATLDPGCIIWLPEVPDGDPFESLYMAEAELPPGGPWIQEAVNYSDSSVIAYDNNVMGELTAVPLPNASQAEKLEFLYQYLAFKRTATGVLETMHKSDGTVLGTAALSDDGTTFTKNKLS